MKKDKRFLSVVFIFAVFSILWSQPSRAEMIKEVAIGVFYTAPNEAQMERYYLRDHGPAIAESAGPWMRRYRLWLPYAPPDDAVKRFGALRGRYAELWFASIEDYQATHGGGGQQKGAAGMSPNAGGGQVQNAGMPLDKSPNFKSPLPWEQENPNLPHANNPVVIVPAKPTETFYSAMMGSMESQDTTFIRWVTVIKYPDGVSVEDGEKWFLEVHAKEAAKQPGLLKFESYRCLQGISLSSDGKSWVRVNEYWYKDFDAWRKAVIESPPKYTAPSWGGKYPFVEMVSTFIPYMHYVDFLKGNYVVP